MPTLSIPLTQGKFALIDEQDADLVMPFKWCVTRQKHTTYAMRSLPSVDGKRTFIYMHRQILSAPPGVHVDHQDGDGLNNQRQNLRLCSPSQNQMNRRSTGGSSRFRGVHLFKATGKWQAYVKVNGKNTHLGYFTNEIEAARAHDECALRLHGEFARLNFGGSESEI